MDDRIIMVIPCICALWPSVDEKWDGNKWHGGYVDDHYNSVIHGYSDRVGVPIYAYSNWLMVYTSLLYTCTSGDALGVYEINLCKCWEKYN